jgi:hypothetical protein
MSPILYKEFFTIDELRLRNVKMTDCPNAIPRESFKIVGFQMTSIESDCIWYDLTCTPSNSSEESVRKSIILDDRGSVKIKTAIPGPGAVVEETMQYGRATDHLRYTYLNVLDSGVDGSATVRCAKMGFSDSRIYEDRFHLLSPFTSLYVLAKSGNGHAMISSSTGMKNHLRIF